jgi:hypothetical protein
MAFSETKIVEVDWKYWEKESAKLTKEDLITFILKRSGRGKRELGKRIEIEERETKVVDSYVDFLKEISNSAFHVDSDDDDLIDDAQEERHDRGKKFFMANEGRKKQIRVLEKDIDDLNKKLYNINEPKQECHARKKEAQLLIKPKVVKNAYQYFEKNSDGVPVVLFEIFIGCLRNVERGTKEDVELYLNSHKGLIVSMNKLEEVKVNRINAKYYADVLKDIKIPITEKEYSKFIPFYVWMDNVIRIIKFTIDEKHIKEELEQKSNTIFKLNHEIENANIVLDHLGIDPYHFTHLTEVIEFWNNHNEDLEVQRGRHNDKETDWDLEHVQTLNKRKNEEEKKFDEKREYPVFNDTLEQHQAKRVEANNGYPMASKATKRSLHKANRQADLPDGESLDESKSDESDESNEDLSAIKEDEETPDSRGDDSDLDESSNFV